MRRQNPLALIEGPLGPREERGYAALLAALKDLPQTLATSADEASGEISLKRASHSLAFARYEPIGGPDDDPFAPAAAMRV